MQHGVNSLTSGWTAYITFDSLRVLKNPPLSNSLLNANGFERPRNGKKNDKAHPPIHPTAHVNNLAGDDKRVYDLIVRRFLACCSKNARGSETTVEIEIAGEKFSAKGRFLSTLYLRDVLY
jgi:DNA topoisomerase-3